MVNTDTETRSVTLQIFTITYEPVSDVLNFKGSNSCEDVLKFNGSNSCEILNVFQMCTDGAGCKRKVCFFAHYEHELRSVNSKHDNF